MPRIRWKFVLVRVLVWLLIFVALGIVSRFAFRDL